MKCDFHAKKSKSKRPWYPPKPVLNSVVHPKFITGRKIKAKKKPKPVWRLPYVKVPNSAVSVHDVITSTNPLHINANSNNDDDNNNNHDYDNGK